MARPLRIEYPGAFYHVMHRGNAGADIFENKIATDPKLKRRVSKIRKKIINI